jgi:hypothetical protein
MDPYEAIGAKLSKKLRPFGNQVSRALHRYCAVPAQGMKSRFSI